MHILQAIKKKTRTQIVLEFHTSNNIFVHSHTCSHPALYNPTDAIQKCKKGKREHVELLVPEHLRNYNENMNMSIESHSN